jgi:hypothetical protein
MVEVYDVLNCGPRHRFAVMSDAGVLIAHNCVQAVARDIFVEILLGLDSAGIHVPFSVHDEAVCEVPMDFDKALVEKIMSTAPEWFLKCPVACEAIEATAYQK